MKVVLYGATGRAGSRILHELLSRGHRVLAIARDAAKLEPAEGLVVGEDDLSDAAKTAGVITGADAVISAYAPPTTNTDELVRVTKLLVEAVAKSGVPRLLMVGGAGSLEVAPGVSLIDSGHLPPEWLAIARSHSAALDVLRSSKIDWTNLCPAAYFDPGERTGKFRLGVDNLISDEKGESKISMEDYAIAMVDELENPRHSKQRFSVGY
jgi:putative NADH-flavin reductase